MHPQSANIDVPNQNEVIASELVCKAMKMPVSFVPTYKLS